MDYRGEGTGNAGGGRGARFAAFVLLASMLPFLAGCFVKLDPISEADHWRRAEEDAAALFAGQAEPTAPVTLAEAVARAVKYNLDHRLSLMETAFALRELEVANYQMLPRVAVNAGYSMRNNDSASSSMSYKTRKQSLEPSFSSERHRVNGDLSFNWSLLDFGLSYFQAKQQADRHLIMEERRRRVMNNLVKDVVADFFRVAAADAVREEIHRTIMDAEEALAVYQKLEEDRKGPLVLTLENERSLINIISSLRTISVQLATAKSRLAALMNLPLGSDFTVVAPGADGFVPPELAMGIDELERIGIYLRPDIREEVYQARIDGQEVKKEILRMIPGVNLFASGNADSNKYLVHQSWAEAGAKTALDLVGLATRRKQIRNSRFQEEVAHTRRLAGTVAAMVQIHMSYYQYLQAVELFRDARKLNRVERRLLELARASAQARETGPLEAIRQSALALNSKLELDRSLIDSLAAWGNLYFSVGGDILRGVRGDEELPALIARTESSIAEWLAGALPPLPAGAPLTHNGFMARSVESSTAMASLPAAEPSRPRAAVSVNWRVVEPEPRRSLRDDLISFEE